jgi:hypothetical protein
VSVSCWVYTKEGVKHTLNGRPDKVIDKLLLNILDDHALSAELLSLLLDSVEVLLLTTVGKEADNLVTLKDQPSEDGAGVKT